MDKLEGPGNKQARISFAEIVRNPRFETIFNSFEGLLGKQLWTAYDAAGKPVSLPLEEGSRECPAMADGCDSARCLESSLKVIEDTSSSGQYQIGVCTQSDTYRAVIPFLHQRQYQGAFVICFCQSKDPKAIEHCVRMLIEYLLLLSEALAEYDDTGLVLPLWDQMVSTRDIDDLLKRVLSEALLVLRIDQGIIFLVDDDLRIKPQLGQGVSEDGMKHGILDIKMRDYEGTIQTWDGVVVELQPGDPIADWSLQVYSEDPSQRPVRILALPIHRDRALVALVVAFAPRGPLDPMVKFRSLHFLLEGAAAAINNATIFEKMNQKALALTCIHAMHRLMNYPIAEQELLSRIGRVMLQALQVNKCSIMLINRERDTLEARVRVNLEDGEIGTESLQCGDGIPGWVWENYAPLIVNSWKDDHRFANEPASRYPSVRYLAMPMIESDVLGVITVSGKRKDFTPGDREVLQYVTEQAVIALNNARLCETQQHLTLATLKSIANVVEMKDPYKMGHTEKVADCTEQIAIRMGLDYETRLHLKYAALLHDTGGIGSRDPNTGDENPVDAVKDAEGHLELSVEIAHSLGLSESIVKMIRHHHENYDGSGYPDGLRGQAIPLGSRIMAVADVFVALTAGPGKHRALSPQEAINFIRNLAGKRFDPEIVSLLARGALKTPQK